MGFELELSISNCNQITEGHSFKMETFLALQSSSLTLYETHSSKTVLIMPGGIPKWKGQDALNKTRPN